MTQYFIKKLDSLAKTTKDIEILQHAHKQPLFGWFPKETCTIFQVAKIHARKIKFHQQNFIESIAFKDVHPDKIRTTNLKFRNMENIDKKNNGFSNIPRNRTCMQIQQTILQNTISRKSCRKQMQFRHENR